MKSMDAYAVLFLILRLAFVKGDEHDHKYDDGDEVVLWMNTIGPFSNRQETYAYYSLPYCPGPKDTIGHYHETLGEALQGVELEYSGLDISFKNREESQLYCSVLLNEVKYETFAFAVRNNYWFQMYIDDLPIWGAVGELRGDEPYVFTHMKFDLAYNGNQIVSANLTSLKPVAITPGGELNFYYEVQWHQSELTFDKRFDRYLDRHFFRHRIHWFSIFNSFVMVLFLVGVVGIILVRMLNKDYARYSSKDDDLEDMRDLGDECGWKQVHGDVFRPPCNALLLSSLVGTGSQLGLAALVVSIMAATQALYTERGSLLSTVILVYAVCCPLNGLVGGSLYLRFSGERWILQLLFSSFFLPVTICSSAFILNFIAIGYHASRAIPFGTMIAVACIVIFVIFPLTLAGTIVGRAMFGAANFPCRVNAVPRPIPDKPWYLEPMYMWLVGGILPFGSIIIEVYFIFTSFWAYKIYYVYGFMLLVCLMLLVVTACVSVVCVYLLLNAEDHNWQWTSFISPFSISIYVYSYSIYYFFFTSKMYGFFQTTFYFTHMFIFSSTLGVMCGSVGFLAASAFVRKIYSTVKID